MRVRGAARASGRGPHYFSVSKCLEYQVTNYIMPVVLQAAAKELVNTTRTKVSGKCADGSVAAAADASAAPADVATAAATSLSEAVSKACGNQATTEAGAVQRALGDAASIAQGVAASNAAVDTSNAVSTVSQAAEGLLADSLSQAFARCKCKGKKEGEAAVGTVAGDQGKPCNDKKQAKGKC